MTLALVTVSELGTKDKFNPQGRKNELTLVATLARIETATATLVANAGQWYALGGVRSNAEALQRLIVENELALQPGYRIECQISEETNTGSRTRRTQTVYVRAKLV